MQKTHYRKTVQGIIPAAANARILFSKIIPTMVLFHQGREIARQSGALMAGDIVRWVQSQAL